jgi:DNA polymerase elongation subunit (family B)
VDAFLLDAYSERNHMVVWLRQARGEGTAIRVEESFAPSFFVRAREDRLARVAAGVRLLSGVGEPCFAERLCALEREPSRVLEVPVQRHDRLQRVADEVDIWGDCYEHELFDVDLRMSHRWFLAKGLFPFAKVRTWTPGKYRLLDEQWATDYEAPPLRVVTLDAKTPEGRRLLREEDRVGSALLNDEHFAGEEPDVLAWTAQRVRELDPDVVLTWGGDRILLQHLALRAQHHDLAGWGLGRDGSPPVVVRRGKSYFSYGKILHRPDNVRIPGRIHIDYESNGLAPPEAGLDGLIEQARIASTPLQDVVRLTTGTAFSTMQIDAAKREHRLVPYRKNGREKRKTGYTLLYADRGALSFDPQVGVWDDCYEFDFASFFPHLMIHRNLSPETVLCDCCDPHDPHHPTDRIVPRVGYHVCHQHEGINGKTLERLVARRQDYKQRRKTRPDELQKWQARSDLLKMELVCSFGYQGHKNHRFGRIEVHESINAWARHDLVRTTQLARDEGFEVLHGLSDSLWARRLHPAADPASLERRVSAEIGVPFDLQGKYAWFVLLPNKTSRAPGAAPVGALTRFYGLFEGDVMPTRSNGNQRLDYLAGGRLKVRGVELRQHSTPRFIRHVQEAILTRFCEARNAEKLRALVPAALQDARALLQQLNRGQVPFDDLYITNSITRELADYAVATPAASALADLAGSGISVEPGESVSYVVLDNKTRAPGRRVRERRLAEGAEEYDVDHYARLAHRAISSLLLPFGYTEEEVARSFATTRQAVLS